MILVNVFDGILSRINAIDNGAREPPHLVPRKLDKSAIVIWHNQSVGGLRGLYLGTFETKRVHSKDLTVTDNKLFCKAGFVVHGGYDEEDRILLDMRLSNLASKFVTTVILNSGRIVMGMGIISGNSHSDSSGKFNAFHNVPPLNY